MNPELVEKDLPEIFQRMITSTLLEAARMQVKQASLHRDSLKRPHAIKKAQDKVTILEAAVTYMERVKKGPFGSQYAGWARATQELITALPPGFRMVRQDGEAGSEHVHWVGERTKPCPQATVLLSRYDTLRLACAS